MQVRFRTPLYIIASPIEKFKKESGVIINRVGKRFSLLAARGAHRVSNNFIRVPLHIKRDRKITSPIPLIQTLILLFPFLPTIDKVIHALSVEAMLPPCHNIRFLLSIRFQFPVKCKIHRHKAGQPSYGIGDRLRQKHPVHAKSQLGQQHLCGRRLFREQFRQARI